MKISDYVELHSENFKVFSTELTKTYLTICSEIDVVLKLLAEKFDEKIWSDIKNTNSEKLHPDMELYKEFLNKKISFISEIEIKLTQHDLPITPWRNIKNNFSPEWWDKYNKVKHSRDKHYRFGCLKNVLHSASGLLVILLLYYGCDRSLTPTEEILPKLFEYPDDFLPMRTTWGIGPFTIPEKYKNNV
ncbi:hypothetical protein [Desulfopila inferna]|uniref:hypothetical protein n=1 Tax=Desulfopila inferna TaxID=468528 RepID=UPI0019646DA3|nr:hypothetical protein [Desulfopila inferna]MBM9606751.1 hypothetical protein [Desulfopila inferna]